MIKPLGNLILIQPDAIPETTASGLYVPETNTNKPRQGTVIEVGTGIYNDHGELIQLQCKKGERVLFHAYSGIEVTITDHKFVLVRESDILGIIT